MYTSDVKSDDFAAYGTRVDRAAVVTTVSTSDVTYL